MKITKRILTLATGLILILMWCPATHASNIFKFEPVAPNPIKKIVKALSKVNIFIINIPAQPSPLVAVQQENYTQLERLATSAELEELILYHKNAVVRLFAFKALTKQLENLPENIMSVINSDSSEVDYINGDKKEKASLSVLAQNFLN